jgi:hypothetical protein
MTTIKAKKPKIKSWCDVSYFHTAWKCPNGCPNESGFEKEVCDHGRVSCDEEMEFYCYVCKRAEYYKIKIKLERTR